MAVLREQMEQKVRSQNAGQKRRKRG